jgi:hypothetical protein|tara:strand:- start:23945 stop:24733 length:789 start_codon:yes stop_codon:yes gene_type:complete
MPTSWCSFGNPTDVADTSANYERAGEWPALSAVQNANAQGAFVFWNHAWWSDRTLNARTELTDFQRDNIEQGLLHGIEIANGGTYSEESFQIALDHDLALIGVSDVHNLIDWDYKPHEGGHRPVTLVFAKEKTGAAIRQALFERRTVVWFKNLLIGRANVLTPLLNASLTLESAAYLGESEVVRISLSNRSDAELQLLNTTEYTFTGQADLLVVAAHDPLAFNVRRAEKSQELTLKFEVRNALIAPGRHASVQFSVQIPDPD